MRSFLTMLGIVIGVSAVVTMVTLGNGATMAVSNQISALGSNLLTMRPGQRGPGRRGEQRAAVQARRRGGDAECRSAAIKAVAPTVERERHGGVGREELVHVDHGHARTTTSRLGNWTLAAGRLFTEAEERSGAPVCVIGETVRSKLFGSANPIGSAHPREERLVRGDRRCCARRARRPWDRDQDDTVIMPIRTVQRRLTGNQDVGLADDAGEGRGVRPTWSHDRISVLMRERRRIASGEEDDFDIMDTREIAETMSGTTQILTVLLGAVAAVSLLVGGIGIMNIMLVSITERTREIGTRLAIGALRAGGAAAVPRRVGRRCRRSGA